MEDPVFFNNLFFPLNFYGIMASSKINQTSLVTFFYRMAIIPCAILLYCISVLPFFLIRKTTVFLPKGKKKKKNLGSFVAQLVRTWRCHCRGLGRCSCASSVPDLGTPTCYRCGQKQKDLSFVLIYVTSISCVSL